MSMAGTGFAVFSAAMLTMRLTGDWLVQKLGGKPIVLGGSVLAIMGFFCLSFWHLSGLFSTCGFFLYWYRQCQHRADLLLLAWQPRVLPLNMAVSAVSTLGYLGILMGPAVIGFIAHQTSLYTSFGLLAGLVVLQMYIASYVYKKIL